MAHRKTGTRNYHREQLGTGGKKEVAEAVICLLKTDRL